MRQLDSGTITESLRHGVAVVFVTSLWLTLLDRIGMAFVGEHVWCGVNGLWLSFGGHMLLSTAVAFATIAVATYAKSSRRERTWARVSWVSAGVTLVLAAVYWGGLRNDLVFGTETVRLAGPMVIAALLGPAAAFLARRPRRWWHFLPWAPMSALMSAVDATVYPGLVPERHALLYAGSVVTGVWGAGLPVARLLAPHRHEKLVRYGVIGCGASMALAAAVAVTVERGFAAATSPALSRLLNLLPARSQADVLDRELRRPPRRGGAPAAVTDFPRGPDEWSVLLITVDALRADALLPAPKRGFYLKAGDTPFTDEWTKGAFRFLNGHSQGNATVESMRSMMQGVRASDARGGIGIPDMARALDLSTAAVVPPFMRVDWLFRAGIFEFERVELYDVNRQEEQVELLGKVLKDFQGERFFAWTHFFCMHQPFYTEKGPGELRLMGPGELHQLATDYRLALKWLDRQLSLLMKLLEEAGRKDSTVVVLTADHGEHLGERLLMGHGDGMHEEDTHVPLIIRVPGAGGGEVRATVSNQDVLATVVDLLGAEPFVRHRGSSMVPIMQARAEKAGRTYYMKGHESGQHALFTDDWVLAYEEKMGAFQVFPIETAVTVGRGDYMGRDPENDARLISEFVRAQVAPFADALQDPETLKILTKRLRTMDDSTSDEDVAFLLDVANLARPTVVAGALRDAFDAAESFQRKARIAYAASQSGNAKEWSLLLSDVLSATVGTSEEETAVRTVADYGLRVSAKVVRERLSALAKEGDAGLIDAWLGIIRTGQTNESFVPVVTNVVAKLEETQVMTDRRLRALLDTITTFRIEPGRRAGQKVRPLAEWVQSYVEHPDRGIAYRACRALGAIGSQADVPTLKRMIEEDARPTVRRSALAGLARLEGSAAVEYLKRWVSDPAVAVAALDEISKVAAAADIRWISQVWVSSKSEVVKGVALEAANNVRARTATGGG